MRRTSSNFSKVICSQAFPERSVGTQKGKGLIALVSAVDTHILPLSHWRSGDVEDCNPPGHLRI